MQEQVEKKKELELVAVVEPALPLEGLACFDNPNAKPTARTYAGYLAFKIGPLRYIHHAP
ncbi:MAG: hypothetical protein QW304_07580 [Thermoproteota archaeon]